MKQNNRESYKQMTHYVATRCGFSFRFTKNVINQFFKTCRSVLEQGNDLQIDNVCTFSYVKRDGMIYKNSKITLDDVIYLMKKELPYLETDIKKVVYLYCHYIRTLLASGRRVNLKNLCYIYPRQKDGYVVCQTIISPTVKKPHNKKFYVLTDNGYPIIEEVAENQLRIAITFSENTPLPSTIEQPNPIQLEQIEI